MLKKLQEIQDRYEELGQSLSDPEIISNQKEFQKRMKQHRSMEEVVEKFREYKKLEETP